MNIKHLKRELTAEQFMQLTHVHKTMMEKWQRPPTMQEDEGSNDTQAEDASTINIYGAIVSEEIRALLENWWGDKSAVSGKSFSDRLARMTGAINIRINSPGGYINEASTIRNLIKGYKGDVSIFVDGACASAATIVALSAPRTMADAGYVFFHKPFSGAYGNEDELAKSIEHLRALQDGIADIYAKEMGIDIDEANRLMADEVMLNYEQAKETGFVPDEEARDERVMNQAAAQLALCDAMIAMQDEVNHAST